MSKETASFIILIVSSVSMSMALFNAFDNAGDIKRVVFWVGLGIYCMLLNIFLFQKEE